VRFIFVLHHGLMAQCRFGMQLELARFLHQKFWDVIRSLIDILGESYVVIGK
jgi:hypothetical protein